MTVKCEAYLVEEALQSIKNALLNYLQASCKRMLAMVRLTGQRRVRIDFYGLYNYYESTESFPRFIDAYSYAVQCTSLDTVSQVLGGVVSEGGESGYQLVLSVERFEDVCREVSIQSEEQS
jgi:hypothetical protein